MHISDDQLISAPEHSGAVKARLHQSRAAKELSEDAEAEKEEYSNSPVPPEKQSVRPISAVGIFLGVATALIWYSLGAQLVSSYGIRNFLVGAVIGGVIVGGAVFVWVRFASQFGLNSDLIARVSGFGYYGSIVTALIFSLNLLLFFGFEGGILINAVHSYLPAIPLPLLQVAFGLIFIPLCWFGIKVVDKLMWWTLPVFGLFVVLIMVRAAGEPGTAATWSMEPLAASSAVGGAAIIQVVVTMLGMLGAAAHTTDFARFVPRHRSTRVAWLLGPLFHIIYFIGPFLLGAWLAAKFHEKDPAIYFVGAFGLWGVFFIVVTQLRINMVNIYSTAVQFSNVTHRLFGLRMHRGWWVTIASVLGSLVLLFDVYSKAAAVLAVWGIVLIGWIGTVVADIVVNRWILKLAPPNPTGARSELRAVNPIGFVSLITALAVGLPLTFGAAGPAGTTATPFITFAITLLVTPLLTVLSRGRFYTPKAQPIPEVDGAEPAELTKPF